MTTSMTTPRTESWCQINSILSALLSRCASRGHVLQFLKKDQIFLVNDGIFLESCHQESPVLLGKLAHTYTQLWRERYSAVGSFSVEDMEKNVVVLELTSEHIQEVPVAESIIKTIDSKAKGIIVDRCKNRKRNKENHKYNKRIMHI